MAAKRRVGRPRKYGRHGRSVRIAGDGTYAVHGPSYMANVLQDLADSHNMSRSGFVIWLVNEYKQRLEAVS